MCWRSAPAPACSAQRPSLRCRPDGPGGGARRASPAPIGPPRPPRRSRARWSPGRSLKIAFTTGPRGRRLRGRFAFVRVSAAHPIVRDHQPARAEWLIVEWPEGAEGPSDYWLSNLPAETAPERLAQLARLRWVIELDYRQLKGELGLDHYEGRSYAGWHHHCALVTCAHAFLSLERLCPTARRPA